MPMNRWIVVSRETNQEDAEAYGPFTSGALAEEYVRRHEEAGVRPAYPLMVVELWPVRELLHQIREEEIDQIREQEKWGVSP